MNQTRAESFVEACINTAIGFVVSYLFWPVAAWLCGISSTASQQLNVTLLFTILSVARSYCVRRWCGRYLKQLSRNLATCLKN